MHSHARLGPYELAAAAFLLLAAVSSYAGPTAAGVAEPESYRSIWSFEPLPPVDAASAGLGLLVCVWGLSALTGTARSSALDGTMLLSLIHI